MCVKVVYHSPQTYEISSSSRPPDPKCPYIHLLLRFRCIIDLDSTLFPLLGPAFTLIVTGNPTLLSSTTLTTFEMGEWEQRATGV